MGDLVADQDQERYSHPDEESDSSCSFDLALTSAGEHCGVTGGSADQPR